MASDGTRLNHRPRVLLLTDNLLSGGVQRVVVRTANGLARRGYPVFVAAEAGGGLWDELDERVARRPLAPGFAHSSGLLTRILTLRKLARQDKVDIVHAHQRGVALAATAGTRGTRSVVVEHVHNVFRPTSKRMTSFRGDKLVACGSEVEQMLIEEYGRAPSRITTILNGVPDASHGRGNAITAQDSSHTYSVTTVARVTTQKRPHLWLDAMELLAQRVPLRATWVGDGELLDELREEVLRRELGHVISLPGESSAVESYIADADVVALTSAWEGLPLVLLEAASLGKPLFATDVGSCRDIIADGVNGRLVAAEDSASTIATALEHLLTSDRLEAYGRASRQAYEREFTVDRYLDDTEKVYEAAWLRR